MSRAQFHKPHHPNDDVPEEFEPGRPPVEPDEGPVPANIPDDPEHDRVIAPAVNLARLAQSSGRQVEFGRCP